MAQLLTSGLGGPAGGLLLDGMLGGIVQVVGVRDDAIVDDIIARLEFTGKFARVVRDDPSARYALDVTPVAVVADAPDWDLESIDPEADVHHGRYTITITVRAGFGTRGSPDLKWLERVTRQAIDGQSLANVTMPALTRVRKARPTPPKMRGQDWQSVLTVETAYLIVDSIFDTAEWNAPVSTPPPPPPTTGYATGGYGVTGYGI